MRYHTFQKTMKGFVERDCNGMKEQSFFDRDSHDLVAFILEYNKNNAEDFIGIRCFGECNDCTVHSFCDYPERIKVLSYEIRGVVPDSISEDIIYLSIIVEASIETPCFDYEDNFETQKRIYRIKTRIDLGESLFRYVGIYPED